MVITRFGTVASFGRLSQRNWLVRRRINALSPGPPVAVGQAVWPTCRDKVGSAGRHC
jgi:hypothetical protein